MLDKFRRLYQGNYSIKIIMVLFVIQHGFLILGGCSENPPVTNVISKKYSVDTFEKVELSGYYNITIVKGDTPKLEISATPEDHELLNIKNDHNSLEVSYKKNTTQNYPIEVKIVTPNLVNFSIHGACDESNISNFSGENLSIEINGAGELRLTGCHFAQVNMVLNGAGSINSLNSTAISSNATVNGSGMIKTNVTEALTAVINGVGTIKYSGAPKMTQQVNGLGTIKQI
ncbi:MAG: hypothetical protein ACJASQ_002361 [Crocinitomicaceae bacterium]|jgi:hypothetical protein